MGVLLPKIKPLIYSNGGPVITVQVRINNWIHYDLKFTYLPKATYYYITLRSRRVRSDVDAKKEQDAGGTPLRRALGSNMSPSRAPFFLVPTFLPSACYAGYSCLGKHKFLHCLSYRDCFVTAFRGKN